VKDEKKKKKKNLKLVKKYYDIDAINGVVGANSMTIGHCLLWLLVSF
jgi:hypothetical protein